MSKLQVNTRTSNLPVEVQVKKEADTMAELQVNGHTHIIRPYSREGVEPNYRNSGMALCGILKSNQTLNQFKKWWIARRLIFVSL